MSCSAIAPTTQFVLLHHHHHHHHRHHHHQPRPKTFHVSAKANHSSDGRSNNSSCCCCCFNRRSLLLFSSSSITSFSFPSSLPLSLAAAAAEEEASSSSSSSNITVSPSPPPPPPPPPPDTTVTDRIFMDFSICPNYFRSDRTLGDELSACQESEPLGRVVFGLYGKFLPQTVANFKAMCIGSSASSSSSSSYKGTLVQKIFPGQYFVAGRQGRRDKGVVRPPKGLAMNMETLDSRAYVLGHSRPGVLSLCLSENDDDDDIKLDPNYRNVEFLVTTGPGPCPMLDDRNIVFGTVLQGLDVVTTIASIPTYKPAERIRQFNDFAEFIGDERAQNARTIWNRPLKTVYISDCGELKVAKPSFSPTLP